MDFGYILKTMRIEAGFGLRELARTIEISPSYLSMVEHGQQPPPTAERISQIEQVLDVPTGYLLSVTRGFDPGLTSFIKEVPEIADFLRMAKEKGMEPGDFMELTGLLNTYGLNGLRKALKAPMSRADESAAGSHGHETAGPYIWPFLRQKLIFDVKGPREKASFLEEAVAMIADRIKGLDSGAVLKGLLEREKAASTGIGNGVAVPHAYTTGLDDMIVAFFRIPEGLEFDAIDGQPVYMAFILAGPRSSKLLHLRLLARIAKLVGHNSFYDRVLRASSHRGIISTFQSAEMKIP